MWINASYGWINHKYSWITSNDFVLVGKRSSFSHCIVWDCIVWDSRELHTLTDGAIPHTVGIIWGHAVTEEGGGGGGGGWGREMVSKNISVTNWWALGISWTIMQQILDLKINYPLTPWMKTYKYWKEMKILSHSILCSMDCWMAIFFRDPIQMLTNLIHKDELGADWYILGLIAASLHLLYFSLHH